MDDVLDKFPTVGFQASPPSASGDTLVDDRGATETIHTNTWLHICQAPARGQGDEEHPGFLLEAQVAQRDRSAGANCSGSGIVDLVPQLHWLAAKHPLRQASTIGFNLSSESTIFNAPIALSAPTEPL